ncbi:hypothetical protein J6590_041658 [Homalodisca vitripennis]|nr:hypothetical protein J6590_041658 [Homalodisca vitripennis]
MFYNCNNTRTIYLPRRVTGPGPSMQKGSCRPPNGPNSHPVTTKTDCTYESIRGDGPFNPPPPFTPLIVTLSLHRQLRDDC